MSKNYRTDPTFTGRIGSDTVNYPYGDSQNDTGSNDGMPHIKTRADDILGFLQSILVAANVTPNGNADTALASQYLDGLKAIMAQGKKNYITNADMSVAQRGTSFTLPIFTGPVSEFTLDRWECEVSGSAGAQLAVSQETFTVTGPTIPAPSPYYIKLAPTATVSSMAIRQTIEWPTPLLEQEVTVSFYANGTADKVINVGVTVEADDGSSGSPDGENITILAASGWARYSATLHVNAPASAETYTEDSHLILEFLGGTDDVDLDITAIQLEVGSSETPFEKIERSQNLAECQRFFQRYALGDVFPGYWSTSSEAFITVPFKVPMRAIPSLSSQGTNNNYRLATATPSFVGNATGSQTLNVFTDPVNLNQALLTIDVVTSEGTAGHGTLLKLFGDAILDFSAEF